MARAKEFRFQHTAVSTPASTGIVSAFADLSGILKVVRPGGDVYIVGNVFPNILSGNVPGQLGTNVTGLVGQTGYLGVTTKFLQVVGPSGQNFFIPAYTPL